MTIKEIKEILSDIKTELAKVDSVNIGETVNSIKYIDSCDSFLWNIARDLSDGVRESNIPSDEIEELENDFYSAKRKLENSLYAYAQKIVERRKELELAIDDIESFLHDGEFAYASEVAECFVKWHKN